MKENQPNNNVHKYKVSRKKAVLITLLGVLMISTIICGAFGFYALGVNFAKTEITLDREITFQTMDGFGASSAWVYQSFGLSGNQELKDDAMQSLFGDGGLALNTFRYNIGAGGTESDKYKDSLRGAQSFFIADRFQGDYSVFADVNNYDFTRDKGVIDLFERALALGNIKEVVFFANSPHYLMTKSGRTSADERYKSNLREECYGAFSDYLLVITNYLYDNVICKYDKDIKVRISPVNEPQWDWGGADASQEGCHYSPKELAKFYDVFFAKMKECNESNSTDFKLDIFESGNYKFNDRKANVRDYVEEFKKYDWFDEVDTISVHSYGAGLEQNVRKTFRNYIRSNCENKKITMSEVCVMQGGVSKGIDMGLYSARMVLRDLNWLDATSWNYWLSISTYDYEDGLLYWDGSDEISMTKRYYAMGHFTKFITDGSVRLKSSYSDSFGINGIEYTPFIRPDGSIVIVVVNNSKSDRQIKIRGAYDDVRETLTTADVNWQTREYKYGGYVTVPSKSIVTYEFFPPAESVGE